MHPPITLLNPWKSIEHAGASNAFAAAPVRSAAGGTILANDPHLELTAPTIWYLARMELSTWRRDWRNDPWYSPDLIRA